MEDKTAVAEDQTETKQERVQVTLRLPKILHDALDQTRPQDQALNPYIVEVLEAGLAMLTTSLLSETTVTQTQTITRELITREDAHRTVVGIIDLLVRRTGSRIDTRDITGTPSVFGLRTLVREALLPSS